MEEVERSLDDRTRNIVPDGRQRFSWTAASSTWPPIYDLGAVLSPVDLARASAHIAELVQPIRAKPLLDGPASLATSPIRRNSPVFPAGRADDRSPDQNAAGQRLGPSSRAIDAVQPIELLHGEARPWSSRVQRGPSRSLHPVGVSSS